MKKNRRPRVCSLCKGCKTMSKMLNGEYKKEHYIAVPCPECCHSDYLKWIEGTWQTKLVPTNAGFPVKVVIR